MYRYRVLFNTFETPICTLYTRCAPTSYKWGYSPYKLVTGVINPTCGGYNRICNWQGPTLFPQAAVWPATRCLMELSKVDPDLLKKGTLVQTWSLRNLVCGIYIYMHTCIILLWIYMIYSWKLQSIWTRRLGSLLGSRIATTFVALFCEVFWSFLIGKGISHRFVLDHRWPFWRKLEGILEASFSEVWSWICCVSVGGGGDVRSTAFGNGRGHGCTGAFETCSGAARRGRA